MTDEKRIESKRGIKDISHVQVYIRACPIFSENEPSVLKFPSKNEITLQDGSKETKYKFDKVFPPHSLNKDITTSLCGPLVSSIISGYNVSFIVYGQTCTGKTYSMLSQDGMIPTTVSKLFEFLEGCTEYEYSLSLSYLQIYQDRIYDLLFNSENGPLMLREHPKEGIVVEGLSETMIKNTEEAITLLDIGKAKLILDQGSVHCSRSHAVCMITIKKQSKIKYNSKTKKISSQTKIEKLENGDANIIKTKLFMCDLAGSERMRKTDLETCSSRRMSEVKFINTSLLELGNVIHALASQNGYVPFRNAPLTRILQESLAGNSKAAIMICISPSLSNTKETKFSLNFGQRAMNVVKFSTSTSNEGTDFNLDNYSKKRKVDYKALAEHLQQKLIKLEDAYEKEKFDMQALKRLLQQNSDGKKPVEEILNQNSEKQKQFNSVQSQTSFDMRNNSYDLNMLSDFEGKSESFHSRYLNDDTSDCSYYFSKEFETSEHVNEDAHNIFNSTLDVADGNTHQGGLKGKVMESAKNFSELNKNSLLKNDGDLQEALISREVSSSEKFATLGFEINKKLIALENSDDVEQKTCLVINKNSSNENLNGCSTKEIMRNSKKIDNIVHTTNILSDVFDNCLKNNKEHNEGTQPILPNTLCECHQILTSSSKLFQGNVLYLKANSSDIGTQTENSNSADDAKNQFKDIDNFSTEATGYTYSPSNIELRSVGEFLQNILKIGGSIPQLSYLHSITDITNIDIGKFDLLFSCSPPDNLDDLEKYIIYLGYLSEEMPYFIDSAMVLNDLINIVADENVVPSSSAVHCRENVLSLNHMYAADMSEPIQKFNRRSEWESCDDLLKFVEDELKNNNDLMKSDVPSNSIDTKTIVSTEETSNFSLKQSTENLKVSNVLNESDDENRDLRQKSESDDENLEQKNELCDKNPDLKQKDDGQNQNLVLKKKDDIQALFRKLKYDLENMTLNSDESSDSDFDHGSVKDLITNSNQASSLLKDSFTDFTPQNESTNNKSLAAVELENVELRKELMLVKLEKTRLEALLTSMCKDFDASTVGTPSTSGSKISRKGSFRRLLKKLKIRKSSSHSISSTPGSATKSGLVANWLTQENRYSTIYPISPLTNSDVKLEDPAFSDNNPLDMKKLDAAVHKEISEGPLNEDSGVASVEIREKSDRHFPFIKMKRNSKRFSKNLKKLEEEQ